MAGGKSKNKLVALEKAAILDWLAQGFTYQEIVTMVDENFSKRIAMQNVAYYKERYEIEILEKREKLKAGFMESIPYANRYYRVTRLSALADQYKRKKRWNEYRDTLKQIDAEVSKVEKGGSMPAAVAMVVNQNRVQTEQTLDATLIQQQQQDQGQVNVEGISDEQASIIAELARSFIERDGDIFADPFISSRFGGANEGTADDIGGEKETREG